MSQDSIALANTSRTTYRQNHNNANKTLATNHSGPNEPAVTYENMIWVDELNSQVKIRNNANNDWIVLFNLDQINSQARSVGNPGDVIISASQAVPTGTLRCDGSTISRTVYADLFAAIGTTWGAGDGSTTFKIPDFRGVFPRGHDAGRGLDSGRVFGSYQADAIRNITGRTVGVQRGDTNAYAGAMYQSHGYSGSYGGSSSSEFVVRIGFDASRVVPTAAENRPKSYACAFNIVY